jgi:hypothetical protein
LLKRVEIAWRGEPVVAALDEAKGNVIAADRPIDLEPMLPRHVGIIVSAQDANRAGDVDAFPENEMAPPVLDELAGNDMAAIVA